MPPSMNQRNGSPRRSLAVALLVLVPFLLSCGLVGRFVSSNRTTNQTTDRTTETRDVPADMNGEVAADGAPLPRKPPPQGMVEVPTEGGGRVLTSRMSGTNSARKMLTALRMGIEGYFDAPPVVSAAFADNEDQNLQAAFTAKLGGVPVRGVMAIQMRGDAGQATLIFDRWNAFPQTFARLAQSITQPGGDGGSGGAGGGGPVQLTPTRLPDGSGQISLPPGWRVTNSYKGTVDAVGPNGEMLGLGGVMAVNTPQVARLYPTVPSADFSDPVRALQDVAAFRQQRIQIIDSRPVQMQAAGRFAFIRFRAVMNGQQYDGLGLYGIQPIDEIQGILYSSYAVAPSRIFRETLPGMWAAWQSWGVSDATLRERYTSAAASMRETGDILTGAYWNRQDSQARVNKNWSLYMRDESMWRDPNQPDTHYRVPNSALPADGDMGRLEPVPLQDLHP